MDLVLTPNPHFIPGYTGYCPQYLYRIGSPYGTLSHKLLIDPCVNHSKNLIVTNPNVKAIQEGRPTMKEIDLIQNHEMETDAVYRHPIIPGYNGFIPNLNKKIGKRYLAAAASGVAEHEKRMQKFKCEARQLKHRNTLEKEYYGFNRSLGERALEEGQYRLPLTPVRAEAQGITRNKLPKETTTPFNRDNPPHFMEAGDPEKYVKLGYAGHVPFTLPKIGSTNKVITNSALCDFAHNYHHRRSPEWVPIDNTGVGTSKPNPNCFKIYSRSIGMIPNYAGHVPGELFRVGKTFGDATVDAKQWLHVHSVDTSLDKCCEI